MGKNMLYKISLQEIEFTLDEIHKFFPSTNPDITRTLVTKRDDTVIGMFAVEMIPGHVVVVHAYMPFRERNLENLDLLRDGFYELFHPWVKSQGKTEIAVTCDYNNKSARTFQEMLGFDLNPIWVGSMPVKEDAWDQFSKK